MSLEELVLVANHFALKEGRYYVSRNGKIWGASKRKFLSDKPVISGYLQHSLKTINDKQRNLYRHVLIKETFDGITPKGMVIDHIDRDKTNCALSNLRFVTRSDNTQNSNRENLGKGRKRPIEQWSIDGQILLCIWPSIGDAMSEIGIKSRVQIHRALNGTQKTSMGFIWKYHSEDLYGEEWRTIMDIQISNKGRVRHKTGLISYGHSDDIGYYRVHLKSKHFMVHRLVCEAFHGLPPTVNSVVNHKDENKLNNCIENLEWLTTQENTAYSKNKAVSQYSLEGEFLNYHESITDAAKDIGVTKSAIGAALRGVSKTSGNFKWSLKQD